MNSANRLSKYVCLLLCIVLTAALFAGCAANVDAPDSENETSETVTDASETTPATAESTVETEHTEIAEMKIQITVGGRTMSATLSDNASAKAFYELLKQGPVSIDMHDYGNFEKVGLLGTDIVKSDESITTTPGDIILYQGNQVTIYYDVNTWNFTLLGHVDGATGENMREFLGDGNVTVSFSLPDKHSTYYLQESKWNKMRNKRLWHLYSSQSYIYHS